MPVVDIKWLSIFIDIICFVEFTAKISVSKAPIKLELLYSKPKAIMAFSLPEILLGNCNGTIC